MPPARALAAAALVALAAPAVAAGALIKAQASPLAAPLVPRDLTELTEHSGALVQLTRGAPPSASREVRRAGGVLVSRSLRVWRLPSRAAVELAPRLALRGALQEVQPDRPYAADVRVRTSLDPLVAQEWWLPRVGADLVVPPGPGKPVTVIDSGLDLAHEEFAGRPNTSALNPQSVEGEDEFHGTAVASVVAAPENGLGVVGVYPQAVLSSWDASPDGLLRGSDVVAGIEAAPGPGVVNLSLGSSFRDPIEEQALLRAVGRGLLIVAAAGNDGADGSPPGFPASLPHVITVAASEQADQVTFFSTRSPATDISAPGEEIPAAAPVWLSPSGYVSVSGTSFAAPIVSGAAAWIWTQRPTLDNTQLAELLRRTARDLGTPGRDADTGFGLLHIPTALAAPTPARDPLEPNDDVLQVRPNGLFAAGKPSLTTPMRARATVNARIDVFEDPEDLYRLWVGAGRRVTVALRATRDLDLQLWNATTRTVLALRDERQRHLLAQSARRGSGIEQVTFVNRGRTGVFVYMDVFAREGVEFGDADYTAQITTARAPAARARR